MDSIIIMATIFNNHPYVSSSKFSANWRAIAIYVEMVVEYCGHDHNGVHITVALLVCVLCHAASAFIDRDIATSARFLFGNLFMETCFCSFLIAVHVYMYMHCSIISPSHAPAVFRHCVGGNMLNENGVQHSSTDIAYRSSEDAQLNRP